MTLTEKAKFKIQIYKLFKMTAIEKTPTKLSSYLKKLSLISSVEADFYSEVFSRVKKIKRSLIIFSDERFENFNSDVFFDMVIYFDQISILFYAMVVALGKSPFGGKFSQSALENNIKWSFLWMANEFVPSPNSRKNKNSFKKISTFLSKNGFEKSVSENLETALSQLDELSSEYYDNYYNFLKTSNVYRAHQNFRELNWAMHCFVGYSLRWNSLFQYITEDKRYLKLKK